MSSEEIHAEPSTDDPLVGRFLIHAEPGQTAAHRVLTDEGMVTASMLREDDDHVRSLPSQPMIETRSALFVEAGITLRC